MGMDVTNLMAYKDGVCLDKVVEHTGRGGERKKSGHRRIHKAESQLAHPNPRPSPLLSRRDGRER